MKLVQRVELQRKQESRSATGAPVSAWTTFAAARAEISQRSREEFLAAYGEREGGVIFFRIRPRDGLDTSCRVLYAGTAYDIKEIAEIGRREWELRATS